MEISENALNLINLIENSGYEAFAVGGCVRDSLMGKHCDDIDITTSATPAQLEGILDENGIRYIETGLKHGTITAVIDKESFEITTYRTEGIYKDNRHPDSVEFVTDLREDLSRRDFTINAMAYNEKNGIVDLYGGKQDIENRIIRCVGDADKRFKEDALRIMRAIRFSSVLGFDIEESTKKAIFDNRHLLINVSAERLFTELSKLLLGDNVLSVLKEYRNVIAVFIPEFEPMFSCKQNNPWHIYDVWEHTCKAVEESPKELKIRLTMLFHDIGKPYTKTTDDNGIDHFKGHQKISADITSAVLKRLKVSNEIYDYLMTLIPIHDVHIDDNKKCIKRWLGRLGKDTNGEYYLKALIDVKRSDKLGQNTEKTKPELKKLELLEGKIDDVIELNEAISVSDLAVNGYDLMALGIKGKEIGIALSQLLDKVINEELENEKSVLIDYIKNKGLNG
ncbi:MAG: HD domain-containing protein [Eubacterium sp.]|nr:HD domain-containing protein [Eubacterium sp.]